MKEKKERLCSRKETPKRKEKVHASGTKKSRIVERGGDRENSWNIIQGTEECWMDGLERKGPGRVMRKKSRAMSEQMVGVASSWLQAGGVKGFGGVSGLWR